MRKAFNRGIYWQGKRFDNVVDLLSLVSDGVAMVDDAMVQKLMKGAFAGGGGILRQARPDSRREILLVAAFYG
ncbi:hypothetical protein P7B04_24540, partial [Sphingobium yanoikuyae]|uniref:hypothetical protein n=1 Tax=Sphingobium yanoikuyae TaxID=13690 RepID=UPI00240F5FDF